MESLSSEMPEFIDISQMDVKNGIKLPTKFISESVNSKPESNTYINEYNVDISYLIVKTNILNIIAMIEDMDLTEDKLPIHQSMCILRNMIILHGRIFIKHPEMIDIVENSLSCINLDYNRFILHKMLNNIRMGKIGDNIHFREVQDVIHNMPPMSVEDRITIEKKLPQFRYTRQIKKAPSKFKVGMIVGAKDKENRWWLSRVLHIHNDPKSQNYWYYIHFEGWPDACNEWINGKTYRVRYFNAKKHFLKR